MSLRLTMLIFGAIVLVGVFALLRRRTLREKYAAIWLLTGAGAVIGAIFPYAVSSVSSFLGFQVTSNFVLLAIGGVLLFTVMQMSLELGKVEGQIQTLSEEIALLRLDQEKKK